MTSGVEPGSSSRSMVVGPRMRWYVVVRCDTQ